MNKVSYKHVVVLQTTYVVLSLLVVTVTWELLGQPDVFGHRFAGPIAGWIIVWSLLNRSKLIGKLAEAAGIAVKAEVLLSPTRTKHYAELFKGFNNCDYIAFNSPFKVEEGGDNLYQEALKIHQKRYQTDGVMSRYLFHDRESFDRAVKFFKQLEESIGLENIKKAVKLRLSNVPQPGYTYFIGEKSGTPACIVYPAARFREGLPDAVIYLENAEELVDLMSRDFNERWRDAENGEHWP